MQQRKKNDFEKLQKILLNKLNLKRKKNFFAMRQRKKNDFEKLQKILLNKLNLKNFS